MVASPAYTELILGWPGMYRLLRAVLYTPPLLSLVLWCWYHWRYRRILSCARKLPTGTPALPIIGHLYLLTFGFVYLVMALVTVGKEVATKGVKTICVWLGPYPLFCVLNAADARTVLTSSKTSEKGGEYRFVKFALGNGLLTAPSEIHRLTKQHIIPLFHLSNLEQLMPQINQSGRHLVKDLSEHVGRGHVNIMRPLTPTMLRNTASVLFGPVEINTKSEGFKGLLRVMKGVCNILVNRLFKMWLWSDAVFEFFWKREIDDMQKHWKSFADCRLKVLRCGESPQQEINDNEVGEVNSTQIEDCAKANSTQTLVDRYDILQQNHPQFTKDDLLNEMLTFIIAGTDSTRITLSSCLLALAAFPHIQERLYQEIVSVTGSEDKDVTVEDINNLPYLDQVLKETLRRFTVSPLITRSVHKDIQLSDCVVPAGSTIGVSLLSLHFDPVVFPEPDKFDPNHFSPDKVAKMNAYSYLPFSGGSRSCIGKMYATMLMKIVLVHVLRRYRVATEIDVNSLKYNFALVMSAVGGYPMELHGRASNTAVADDSSNNLYQNGIS